ncbi:MAG: metal-dependent phosphohydrolase, partial [Polyangiales bacterium]
MSSLEPHAAPSAERAVRAFERAAIMASGPGSASAPTVPEVVVATSADLEVLPVQIVRAGLDRVLMGNDPEAGLDGLLEGGILELLLPEVSAMVGFGDGEWRHKDIWKHTKQVVSQATPRIEV